MGVTAIFFKSFWIYWPSSWSVLSFQKCCRPFQLYKLIKTLRYSKWPSISIKHGVLDVLQTYSQIPVKVSFKVKMPHVMRVISKLTTTTRVWWSCWNYWDKVCFDYRFNCLIGLEAKCGHEGITCRLLAYANDEARGRLKQRLMISSLFLVRQLKMLRNRIRK